MSSLASTLRPSSFPRALVRASTRAQRELWGLKLTRLYGIGIGISYAVMVFASAPTATSISRLWLGCVGTASWIVGIGALSLSTDLAARDDAQGISQLAALRGYGREQLEQARALAGAIRLSGGVLIPAAITLGAALLRFRSPASAGAALALLCITVPYAALLGGSLSLLARAAQRWLPTRGRWLLLALTLGPWLLAKGTGLALPSLPGGFSWLLHHAAGSVR